MDTDKVDAVIELMKTLIHSIIYSRRIYTSAIYGCTRKYGMVLPACLFPALSKNIDKNLELARMFLINDQMLCVHLCIYDLDNRGSEPIERYVFDLSAMSSLVKEKLTKEEFDKYIETIARYNIFELDEKLNSLKSLDDMNNEFNIYLETVHMKEKEVEVIEDDSACMWINIEKRYENCNKLLPINGHAVLNLKVFASY